MSCSFQRFLRESDKRPRELCLQIDGVILMPFVNHAFKPRRLLIPFKLMSVSLRAPSRVFSSNGTAFEKHVQIIGRFVKPCRSKTEHPSYALSFSD